MDQSRHYTSRLQWIYLVKVTVIFRMTKGAIPFYKAAMDARPTLTTCNAFVRLAGPIVFTIHICEKIYIQTKQTTGSHYTQRLHKKIKKGEQKRFAYPTGGLNIGHKNI